MKNYPILLLTAFLLRPCTAEAPPFPPTSPTRISLSEKGPLPVNATVAGLPVTLRGSAVIVSACNNDNLGPVDLKKNALAPFTALLRTYPHAHTVELSWFMPIFLDADSADVLYDRAKHTVTVDYSYGGGIDPQHTGKVVFTGVRESVFAAMLKAHPNGVPEHDTEMDKIADTIANNAYSWGGFKYLYLPRYGCRVSVVKRHRHSHSRHAARRRD